MQKTITHLAAQNKKETKVSPPFPPPKTRLANIRKPLHPKNANPEKSYNPL